MPRVSLLTAPPPERAGVVPAERQAPLADGFVGDRNAPLGQQIFDIPEAETVSVVEPHGVADDVGRKAMPEVAGSARCHPDIVPRAELT